MFNYFLKKKDYISNKRKRNGMSDHPFHGIFQYCLHLQSSKLTRQTKVKNKWMKNTASKSNSKLTFLF